MRMPTDQTRQDASETQSVMTRVATSPGFTRGLRVWICHLRAQGLIIISPGHPSRHTVNFYFFYLRSFEVRDICWRFIELLKFYSVIWQHCTLQT
jgi:hypothetical protein